MLLHVVVQKAVSVFLHNSLVLLERLTKKRDYKSVAKSNRKFVTPSLVFQALSCEPTSRSSESSESPEAHVRLGYTASRRVGGAVQRNRAKRRLKAATRQVFLEQAIPPGQWDCVFIARQMILHRNYSDLIKDIERALKRTILPPKTTPSDPQ